MRIFLVGFMGAGKSHLGRALAIRTGLPFYDLDAIIEQRAGRSISDIFAFDGETYFRQQEANCLRELAALDDFVLACGGGAPCYHDNMAWMNAQGATVYLNTPESTLLERLLPERYKRPLLADLDEAQLAQFIRQLTEKRQACYAQARYSFDNSAAADASERLLRFLQEAGIIHS
jgi:shikimate kinase